MRVTDYELFTVPPRWQFLKLETADGTVGWGEPYTKWHTLEDSEPATTTAVDQLMTKYVLGADPLAIEDCWQAMYERSFYRGGPVHMSAIAGIDEALWDIKGKHYGAPVYDLLGGRARDRIRLYQHVGGDDPGSLAASARAAVDDGYTAVKTSGGLPPHRQVDAPAVVAELRESVAAVREAVGPACDVAVDLHGKVQKPMAKRLVGAVEPQELLFVEEPVTPEYNEFLPDLAATTNTPIATGERMYTRMDFKPLLESGGVDVVQPDVSHAGGITETRKIAAMADAYDVALAPHCPIGPLALAASLHVDACSPNALLQEQILFRGAQREDGWRSYLHNPEALEPTDGYVDLPSGPGLGLDVDEEAVRERDGEDLNYTRGIERLPDGSVTGS
ncbi:MAG: galactonate dehydratase [Haloarculaceae archaeon]